MDDEDTRREASLDMFWLDQLNNWPALREEGGSD